MLRVAAVCAAVASAAGLVFGTVGLVRSLGWRGDWSEPGVLDWFEWLLDELEVALRGRS